VATVNYLQEEIYSGDLRVDVLLHSTADWNYLMPARNTLYYSFDLSPDVLDAAPASVTGFNTQQRTAAIALLSDAASLTGINFVELASGFAADIHFAACDLPGASTAGLEQSLPSYTHTAGDQLLSYTADAYVFLDNREFAAENNNPLPGGKGYQILLHEIGHALGLGHPFDSIYTLPASQDNDNNTVMSYTWAGDNKTTYQSYDLLALNWIYGQDGLGGNYGYNSSYGPTLARGLSGGAGNDTLAGGSGSDYIDGGAGRDTVRYTGPRAHFTVTLTDGRLSVIDNVGSEGADTLLNIERLEFADQGIDFDTNGNAGQVYRLYQGAFNRAPDSTGLGDWIYGMENGMSLLEVSHGFFNSVEFKSIYGQNPANSELVTRFYQNVLHRAPEQAGYDYWMNQIESGWQTRAQVLSGFSESPENQAQLIGVIAGGIEYTLHHV
jgi:serralysin